MEKKQSQKVNISLLNSDKKRKPVYIFPWKPLIFEQIDSK